MDSATLLHIVAALLALIILVDVSVLWLTGRQVPDLLGQLVLAVFATYFASTLSRPRPRADRRAPRSDAPAASTPEDPA